MSSVDAAVPPFFDAATLVQQQYAKLGKTGKPQPGEWTVLAGVVLARPDAEPDVGLEFLQLVCNNSIVRLLKRKMEACCVFTQRLT